MCYLANQLNKLMEIFQILIERKNLATESMLMAWKPPRLTTHQRPLFNKRFAAARDSKAINRLV
jgi:ABC-type taurine transport system ATPase subunit